MKTRNIWGTWVAASALFVAASGAQAAVVGFSPNADLSASPFTFSFGNNEASYTFSDSGVVGGFFGNSKFPAITTGGTAKIASLGLPFNDPPEPTTYFTEERSPFIDGSLASFLSYSAPATIDAETDSYVALQFALADGTHYGFARLSQLSLFDYAYETTPGVGIKATTAFAPSPVPVPAAFPLLGLGIAAFGGIAARKRKRAA